MSKITAIEVQKKDKQRYSLFVDGEFFSGVSMETVIKHHLKVGLELDKKELAEILYVTEKEKALKKALDYVSKALKTKRQVKEYLLTKEFSEEIVFNVLDKLIDYVFINDYNYCLRYIEAYSKTQGRKLMEYKLMLKGVSKTDIEKAFMEVDGEIDNVENVYNLAVKHLKGKERTLENYSKTYRYLASKGYLFEDIDKAMYRIKGED